MGKHIKVPSITFSLRNKHSLRQATTARIISKVFFTVILSTGELHNSPSLNNNWLGNLTWEGGFPHTMQRCNNQTAHLQMASQQRMGTQPKAKKQWKPPDFLPAWMCWYLRYGTRDTSYSFAKIRLSSSSQLQALGVFMLFGFSACLFLNKVSINYVTFLFFHPKGKKKSYQQKFVSYTSKRVPYSDLLKWKIPSNR